MAKQNRSKVSATVQRLRVSLLFKLSTTWLREAIKKPMKLWTLSIAPMTPPEPYKRDCYDVIIIGYR